MSKSQGSVVQTFRYSKSLLIRLEYSPKSQMQRVYFNNEQRSALAASPGHRCIHEFGGHDLVAEERGCKGSEWRIIFAVENGTLKIVHSIQWRERLMWPPQENKSWLTLDQNATSDRLKEFPIGSPGQPVCVHCGKTNLTCHECEELVCECGATLACPACEGSNCECGAGRVCPNCDICDKCNSSYQCQCEIESFDVNDVSTLIRQQDPELVRAVLIDVITNRENKDDNGWMRFAATFAAALGFVAEIDEDADIDDDDEDE